MRDAPSRCSDIYVYTIVLDLRHFRLQTLSGILTTMLTFQIQVYKYLTLPRGIAEVVLDFTDGCYRKPLYNC